MARKEKTYTVESGRDAGKVFLIKEMPLLQADRWAQRALFGIARAGIDTSAADMSGGMLEMSSFAFQAIGGIDPEVGGELLDELLTCVEFVPSGGVARTLNIETDIEDIRTLYLLRMEAFKIHVDFLTDGGSPDTSN